MTPEQRIEAAKKAILDLHDLCYPFPSGNDREKLLDSLAEAMNRVEMIERVHHRATSWETPKAP